MLFPRLSPATMLALGFFSAIASLSAQNLPVVLQTLPPVNVPKSGGTLAVPLAGKFGLDGVIGPIARFNLVTGIIDVELYPEVTPATVANFRKYMNDKDYDATYIHRAVPNFVIQGGGYKTASFSTHISTDSPVKNEFQRSNIQGTIAMAKLGGNINSATSEWYFNLVNNVSLDAPGVDYQFTVFGQIIGKGLPRAVAITSLPIVNLGGAQSTCPLYNYTGGPIYTTNLVALTTLREIPLIPSSGTTGGYLTLSATSSVPGLVTPSISGGTLTLKSVGSSTGTATITVKALDTYGQSVSTTFLANVVNTTLPLVTLTSPDGSANEAAGNTATFRLTRSGSTAAALSVNISLTGSTAVNGADFNTIASPVVIPAGAAFKDVIVTPKQDATKEGIENVKLTVTTGTTYTAAPLNNLTLPIYDDDVPNLAVSLSDATATEASTTDLAKIRFTRNGPTTAALAVPFTYVGTAIYGQDFTLSANPAVIPAGATFVDVTITGKEDPLKEGLETIIINASPMAAYNLTNPTVTANLLDNDVPNVSVSISDGTASEPASDTGKVKITRTGATTWPLTVYLIYGGTAARGTDYVTPPLAVTIPAGQTVAYLTLTPKDDTTDEPVETITVAVKPSVYLNAVPGTVTVSLNDND